MAFLRENLLKDSGQSQGNVFLCLLPSPYCFHSFALSSVKNDESSNQTIQGSLEGESDIKIKSDQRLSQGSQLFEFKDVVSWLQCHRLTSPTQHAFSHVATRQPLIYVNRNKTVFDKRSLQESLLSSLKKRRVTHGCHLSLFFSHGCD